MPDDRSQKSSPVTLEEYDAMGRDAKVAVWLEISDISEMQFKAYMATE